MQGAPEIVESTQLLVTGVPMSQVLIKNGLHVLGVRVQEQFTAELKSFSPG
jgi:hypothetical protein